MFKRILCCMLCLLLVPALCHAETAFTMAGYDGEDSTHSWETNQFFTRMQVKTGVSFTYQQYTNRSQWQTAKANMFATGELPDVLFKAALTTPELIDYTQSGQLIDLKPLLEQYAPNLWAYLTQNPDALKAITLPSGMIGALPAIQPQSSQNVLWINKTWLDALKLQAPTDMGSLKAVLTAFRDGDPNQNGKKDEKPLMFLGPWELKFLSHAYGVVANNYNIYLDDAAQVRYWPSEDSFWALAADLRDLYQAGLIDKDGFQTADTLRRITDDDATVTYGAFFAPTAVSLLPFTQSGNYIVLEPLAYEGKQVYRDLQIGVTRGTFAITSACKDPAALIKWVDVLYGEPGAVEAMAGVEGDVYIEQEGGLWGWKGGIESIDSTVLAELSIYDTGDMPWLFPQGFYERYEDAEVRRVYAELHKLDPYLKAPFPVYTLTNEQSAQIAPLQDALGRYVDETLARLVIGELELTDENKAAFIAGLDERGMAQLVAFWQGVADAQ